MLVGVEKTDKFDNCTLAVDWSDEEFGSIEASLCQVLRENDSKRTAASSATDRRTEGFRRAARDREETRSEEHD